MAFLASLGNAVNLVLDPLFGPLLKLGPFWTVVIISLVLAVLTTLVYKWVTDQARMKDLRERASALQKEIKKAGKDDPKKALELQKKLFEMSKEQMMGSFKPMIITMLPLLIIFGWLNTHMGYEPLQAGEEFTTTMRFDKNVQGNVTVSARVIEVLDEPAELIQNETARWRMRGKAGIYDVEYVFMGKTYTKDIIIQEKGRNGYAPSLAKIGDGLVKTISIDMEQIQVLNIFGWKLGWLGTYIIFSLIFTFGLRKLLKVY